MQSQAATEVGIGFESASSTTSSSQSSTIDTTTSTSSTTTSSPTSSTSIDSSTTSSSLIGGIVPLDYSSSSYRYRSVQQYVANESRLLPQTGETKHSWIFISIGAIVLLCAGALYFYQLRGVSDEKS